MTPVKKKQHAAIGFFSLLALLFAVVAHAQVPLPEVAGSANLTITVTLDKPLDDAALRQYRQLSQQLVMNLPDEITRPEDLNLLTENPAYKNMQVVAYFPVINGKADTQAVIKNYRLRFVYADAQQPDPSLTVVRARDGYLSVTPTMGVSIRLQKPGTEPRAEAKPLALPKAVTPDAATLPKLEPLTIVFARGSANLTVDERRSISQMAAALRNRNDIKGFAAIVATSAADMRLGDERLQQIIAVLRQLDVDVSRQSVTEIHFQTKSRQYVRFEAELKEEAKK